MPNGSLVYSIVPEQSVFLNIIIVASLIITLIIAIYNGIKFSRKVGYFERKKEEPIEIPELQELTKKMGIKISTQLFWELDAEVRAWAKGNSKRKSKSVTYKKGDKSKRFS